MCTYLGTAGKINENDLDENTIKNSQLTFLEGYLWDEGSPKKAFDKAINLSNITAMSLSDKFCVDRHKDSFLNLLKNKLDIVFANEQEIFSLLNVRSIEEAIIFSKELNKDIIITRGEKGAIAISQSKVFECDSKKNLNILDLTGAGDLFAAGYLHGKINNPFATSVSTTNGAYFAVSQATGNVQIEGLGTGAALELTNGGSPVAISFDFNTGTAGQVITATGNDGFGNATGATWATPTGLQTRKTASVTQSIAAGASADVSISTAKGFVLYSIQTSHAAWVTLYTDTNSRTADAGRVETTDPTPGSGVLSEVITTGSVTQLITPGTICFNSSGIATTYAKVVNKSGSTANVQVTLTYLQIEA